MTVLCGILYFKEFFEMKNKKLNVSALTECAIMVALSTILSLITLGSFPTGGSITLASMMPIVIVAYRRGVKWGLLSAGACSLLQMIIGLSAFSYVTTWQSVLAVAFLDFVFAFIVYGFAGIFRKAFKEQTTALVLGAFFSGALRYLCHVVSGATVWAGLSIPDNAALLYSLSYNATYMIPDTLILCIITAYISSVIDFNRDMPTVMKRKKSKANFAIGISGGLVMLFAVIFDIVAVFTKLQSESGEFDAALISSVNWELIAWVNIPCVLISTVLFLILYIKDKKAKNPS